MTRHSKNCTANTVYTYHERRKDAKHSGYGTQTVRLGKDSIRAFDCCCLTLQPAKDPVITPDGFIYDRAAVLEYILSQKADIKRRQKIYAKQCDRAAREALEKKKAAHEEKARAFMALNTLDTHSKASAQAAETAALASASKGSGKLISVESEYKPGTAASFWTQDPSATTSLKQLLDIPKPDPVVRCPMSRKPLRYKDLITVNFTNLETNHSASGSSNTDINEIRRVCAVSKDPLTSATRCFVLRPSGAVVTRDVVEKIIRKEMIDPISGAKLEESDLIEVQVGCGGFADGRSVLTASRVAPASTSGLDDLVGEFPCIPFESSQLDILTTPDAFYNALEGGIKAAQRRVIIATLYFGTGQLEKRLVKAIGENPYRPKIVLLADLTRSTRSLKVTAEFAGTLSEDLNKCNPTTTQSSPLFLLRRITHVPSARVALYQHHRLRGCLSRILPERLNETVGLQHMKLCVFDNNVIVSGANLSEEYFKTRQDRAWLFRDVQGLAEFYAGLVDVVASLSYHLTPEGELKIALKEVESLLGDRAAYCRLFRSRVEAFIAKARLKYTAARASPTDCGNAVFPIVQMGAYGVRQETPLVQRILRSLPLANLALTTGYFCPTLELEAAMIDVARRSPHPSPQIRVLCAAPEANSFFNSKGLSGNIPAAYREVLISFLRRIAPFPHIRVHEYFRPGWTFHAKGLWADMAGTAATLTLVGSSNFGYRSRDLDLESQVLVVARDEAVRRRIEAERSALWDGRYLRPVTAAGLSRPPQPRLRWYARWMLPLLRRLM